MLVHPGKDFGSADSGAAVGVMNTAVPAILERLGLRVEVLDAITRREFFRCRGNLLLVMKWPTGSFSHTLAWDGRACRVVDPAYPSPLKLKTYARHLTWGVRFLP